MARPGAVSIIAAPAGPAPAIASTLAAPGSADPASGRHVELQDLWHRYGDAGGWTLQAITFTLHQGELVGLLGPSGCGKTTLLRLIAGFERPHRGAVLIDGRPVAAPGRWLPPERRGVGMVFQDYALFPHLNAWANTCFGLPRGHDSSRAGWLLELLGLAGLERRYPHELSGGQRQRLALARALAPGPSVVLLDEPFSNLDVEVRLRLRAELPGVLAECGASGLIVTHDPEEALAICDRVAVLQAGALHQCESPRQLVERPASAFVGRFVLQGNLLPARWDGGRVHTDLGLLEPVGEPHGVAASEAPLEVLVSPEAIALEPAAGEAVVMGREFLGREWLYQVQLDPAQLDPVQLDPVQFAGRILRLRLPLAEEFSRGQRCGLKLRPQAQALLFPNRQPLRALP
jgi:iron(III) transport system ATP-binding protein